MLPRAVKQHNLSLDPMQQHVNTLGTVLWKNSEGGDSEFLVTIQRERLMVSVEKMLLFTMSAGYWFGKVVEWKLFEKIFSRVRKDSLMFTCENSTV